MCRRSLVIRAHPSLPLWGNQISCLAQGNKTSSPRLVILLDSQLRKPLLILSSPYTSVLFSSQELPLGGHTMAQGSKARGATFKHNCIMGKLKPGELLISFFPLEVRYRGRRAPCDLSQTHKSAANYGIRNLTTAPHSTYISLKSSFS